MKHYDYVNVEKIKIKLKAFVAVINLYNQNWLNSHLDLECVQ